MVRGRGNIAGRGRGKVSVVERQKRYRLSTVGEPGRAIKACHGNRRKAIKLAITNMTIDNWTGTETAADMTFIISLCGAGVSPPSVATCNISTSVCPRWPDLLHWPHSNVHLCTSVSVSNISYIATAGESWVPS